MANRTPGLMSGLHKDTGLSTAYNAYEQKKKDLRAMRRIPNQTTPTSVEPDVNDGYFDPAAQYRSQFTQDYGSNMAAGRGYIASGLVNDTIASNTGAMDSNERYQRLAAREDEIKARILEIDAEINYQSKLSEREMMGDPEWEIAKNDYIYKGDRSGIDNIMTRLQTGKTQEFQKDENRLNRESNENIAKMNKAETKLDQERANKRAAVFARDALIDFYQNYEAVKADETKAISASTELLKAYQQLKEKADAAGMTEKELFSENPEQLQLIKGAITNGRSLQTSQIQKAKEKADAAAARTAEDNRVSNEVDTFNSTSHSPAELKKKKAEMTKNNPNFIFEIKNGQLTQKRKAGK